MALELAAAYVSIVPSAKGFASQLKAEIGAPLQKVVREEADKAGARLEKGLSDGVRGAASKLAVAFAGIQVGGFLKGAIDGAVSTGEQLSKLSVLVGDSADDVDKWSKTMASAFGISRREALTAAGTFATFFKGVGKTGDEAAGMSKKIVELAGDMASFNDTTTGEALEALGAALRGESEPIRRFGVLLDDATLKQRALDEGLVDTTKGVLPPAIRLQAAYAEILAQTAVQQGDAARTSDSLANQQRQLSAAFTDAKDELGRGLLPIAQRVVDAFADGLLPAFQSAVPVVTEMANSLFDAGASVTGFLAPLSGVGLVLGEMALGAGAAFFAVDKLKGAVDTAKAAFLSFQATTATLSGGLSLIGGLLAGSLLLAFTAYSAKSAEAKADQQGLTGALLEAGDPTQRLVSELGGLVEQLGKVGKNAPDAKRAIEGVTEAQIANIVANEGTIDTLNEYGVTSSKIVDLTRDGGKAFGDAAQQALNLAAGTSDLALATERANEPQAQFIRSLFDLNKQGKLSDQQLADIFGTLNRVSDAYRKVAEASKESLRADIAKAVQLETVSNEWVEQMRAASGVADEYGQLTFIGARLTEVLKAQGIVAPSLAEGLDKVGGAAGGAAAGIEGVADEADSAVKPLSDAEQAAEDFADRMKDLKTATDNYFLHGIDYDAALDKFRDASQRLSDSLGENGTSLSEFTVEGRENRDALRGITEAAAGVVQGLAEAGGTAAQQATALQTLAGEAYTTAINMGLGEDAAILLRDSILQIPTTATTTVTVTDNFEEFKRRAIEAAKVFNDNIGPMSSAALVAAGFNELGGNVDFRAAGGPVAARQMVVVGENGPELFVPKTAGVIIPNDLVGAANAIHPTITLPGSSDATRSVTFGDVNISEANNPRQMVAALDSYARWKLTGRGDR